MNEKVSIKIGSIVQWRGEDFDIGVVLKIGTSFSKPCYDVYWFVEKVIVDRLSDIFIKVIVP